MGYKLDLLQPKQDVFWHLTHSRLKTNNAWKISLEVKKFVYLQTTYVLSVLIIGLNITCTNFWILWICNQPTSYLYTISTHNMTRTKWWNTSIVYNIWLHSLAQLGMKKSPVRKSYGYDTLQPGHVLSNPHFRHKAPPYMQSGQCSWRRKMELFVERAVL